MSKVSKKIILLVDFGCRLCFEAADLLPSLARLLIFPLERTVFGQHCCEPNGFDLLVKVHQYVILMAFININCKTKVQILI